MASILRKLNDADLVAVCHMIRRKARTQLQIAKEAERLLGKKIADTNEARQRIISRYANSDDYQEWLVKWENRDADLAAQIATQKERYALLSNLVQDSSEDGFEDMSKMLQARLLTLAAEADDEELKKSAGSKGWVANIMRIAQEATEERYKRQAEKLKEELSTMLSKSKGKAATVGDVVDRVDVLMGLKKA